MKKTTRRALPIALLSILTLTSCGQKARSTEDVQAAIADAEKLDEDALFKKAAEELGGGTLKILATSSRGGKPAVKNKFAELMKKHNPNFDVEKQLVWDTTVDGTIYTTLLEEIKNGKADGYSGALVQDGYQLQTKGIDTKYFQNYIPKKWKDDAASDKTAADPFTLQYNFKTFMYNNKDKTDMVIDNVWDITDSSYRGKIDTMNPRNENVNMDWLIQLTSDDNEAMLRSAYEAESRTSDVTIDSKIEKPYSHAFIKAFLDNAVFYDDDGKAIGHLAQTPGNVGWIVYSKLLKVNESDSISKKNIVVAALGADNADGKTMGDSKLAGFGGFMYKHYLQIMPHSQYPYATCALFELISTDATAYSVWGADVGDYPSLPTINKDRSKGGHGTLGEKDNKGNIKFTQNDSDPNLFSCLNDPSSDWWINKSHAVIETPSFIGSHYDKEIGFIDGVIAAKKN